jgi:hypothetical protein
MNACIEREPRQLPNNKHQLTKAKAKAKAKAKTVIETKEQNAAAQSSISGSTWYTSTYVQE